ncbi:hypothetical protein [Methylorubrum thiocyanatum]|uniref:hypothetical protein n=1 Tax=Methylorubrum thiocyanatum TaxID=47958 RepID=UPI0035C8708C
MPAAATPRQQSHKRRATADGQIRRALMEPLAPVVSLCLLLAEKLAWRESGEALVSAFDDIGVAAELDRARTAPKLKGRTLTMELTSRLRRKLADRTLSTAKLAA